MKPFQKVIKYGAIAFGIYLSFIIIGIIVFAITTIFGIAIGFETYKNSSSVVETQKWEQEYSNINNLEIDLSICKLDIKVGDTQNVKVEGINLSDKFECKATGDRLILEDDKLNINWFNTRNIIPEIILYLPENFEFDKIEITTGANETNIENIESRKLDLEMGVGKYRIQNLKAQNCKIETGAGDSRIENANIEVLELDGGIGQFVMNSEITNRADIDSGIGRIELNLLGNKENYKIKAHTGLGSFKVDGNNISDNQEIGKGDIDILVEAGVGETIVDFVN